MKLRSSIRISFYCVLLLIISVVGMTACSQDAVSPEPNPTSTTNTNNTNNTNIAGEYRMNHENGYIITIFRNDMTFDGIRASYSDSSLEFHESGVYTVNDNLVTITWDSGVVEELTYDPIQKTLTSVAYDSVYQFFADNTNRSLSIAGNWKPLFRNIEFPLAFGDLWYKYAYSIKFYQDGSYELDDDGKYSFGYSHDTGTYQIIQDGSAIKIDDTDYRDPGIMKFELLSENILLIESRPDSYPGKYYVLVQNR